MYNFTVSNITWKNSVCSHAVVEGKVGFSGLTSGTNRCTELTINYIHNYTGDKALHLCMTDFHIEFENTLRKVIANRTHLAY